MLAANPIYTCLHFVMRVVRSIDDLTCAPASTIIVTVSTTTTVTETADLATKSTYSSNAGPDTFSLATSSHSMPFLTTSVGDTTETTVIWETYTSDSSAVEASSPIQTSPASGLYSFLVVSGITSWLGGFTPPATGSVVIATATVVIEPVPTNPSLSSIMQAQSPIPMTSIETIQVTSIFTADLAETLTESASATFVSATAGGFHGIGTYGWNATTLTRITHVKHVTGTGHLPCATGASSDFAHHSLVPFNGSALIPSNWSTQKQKRQVGVVVTATIDGVVVSWTNSWDGFPATSEWTSASSATWSGTTVSGPPEPSFTAVSSDTDLTTWPTNSQVTDPIPGQATSVDYSSWPTNSQITISTSVTTYSVVASSAEATSSIGASMAPPVLSSSDFTSSSTNSQAADSTIVEPTSTESTSIVTTSSSFINTLPLFPSTYTTWTPSTIVTVYSVPTYTVVPVMTSSFSSLSVAPFPNTTSTADPTATTTGPIASSSACNVPDQDIGNFTITFDDLPTYGGSPGDTDYPPIFNRYHNLVWSLGFAYAPPPSDPYPPISPPQLGVFVTNQSANVHPVNLTSPPGPGDDVDGMFGAGPNFGNSAFWINAYSAYLGCANAGPDDCEITINGYGFDPVFANTVLVARQTAYQPPCVGLTDCTLIKVTFTQDFQNLTGLQIIASVGTNPLMYTWYVDNLEIGWTVNNCEAATNRYVDSGSG
ncbi:hypothetical protein MMC17_005232 [Xylographa soralifera]|nr:hypothetical protein [Xylographa soralifera]